MGSGLVVTGTDTGVGKTLVTAGIVRWLRRQGIDAVPMKAIQTGAVGRGGRLTAPDLEFCLATSGINPSGEERELMSPYLYEPACSPHLAGRLAGRYPELSRIQECAARLLRHHQCLVVEGTGGAMVPVNESATMLDLMALLSFPVVLVSRAGLGTINHTLLSLRALREAELKVTGIVFNHTAEPLPGDRYIEEDNRRTIAQLGQANVLGRIRWLDRPDPENEATWEAFEKDMPGLASIMDALRS